MLVPWNFQIDVWQMLFLQDLWRYILIADRHQPGCTMIPRHHRVYLPSDHYIIIWIWFMKYAWSEDPSKKWNELNELKEEDHQIYKHLDKIKVFSNFFVQGQITRYISDAWDATREARCPSCVGIATIKTSELRAAWEDPPMSPCFPQHHLSYPSLTAMIHMGSCCTIRWHKSVLSLSLICMTFCTYREVA